MKIGLIGSKTFDSLEFHVAESLQHIGHIVHHVDMKDVVPVKYLFNYWGSKFLPNYANILFAKLANKIIENSPELVICTYRFIPPEVIKRIKLALPNIPVVHLNPDQLTTFEKQQVFASNYDIYFTKDPYIEGFMKNKAGLNAVYLPEAFNQRIHKAQLNDRAILESSTNIDVLVFGSIYPYRANMVKQLINAGINVTMFGDNQHNDKALQKFFRNEWITGTRKSELLIGSKVVFNNFHYAEINSVNCKFFEIAGTGGFQICDYKPCIKEYSAVDPDKFTFNTIGEAIEKIKFYLSNPELRYNIAEQQRLHFLDNHSYDKRMEEMIKIIFK